MTSSTEPSRASRSGPYGHLEGDVPGGEGALGADDALGDGRLRGEEGAGDLRCRQAAEQPQGEGDAGLGGQDRVAGGEDEPQQVVVDVVGVGGFLGRGDGLQGAADLRQLAGVVLPAPDQVDGAVPGGGHEPGARVVGHTVPRPLLQGGDQRVLGEFLGDADVADDAGDGGDDARGLDAVDGLDGMARRPGRTRRRGCRWAAVPQPTMQHPRAGPAPRIAQPSAISRTSQVTVQYSSWTFTNRLVHSSASSMSLHWVMA